MIHAYVMLNIEPGSEETVLKKLKVLDIVEEAYVSYGVYDVIVKVKAENMVDLTDAVTNKIRATDQVQTSLTLVMTEQEPVPN